MTNWGASVRALAVWAVLLAACSDDEPSASSTTSTSTTESTTTTTAPERPASTTTTAYDASTVEGQVEAAYLRSWDVYADAVYNLQLDEQALAEVYAGEHLETKRAEIQRRIEEGAASLVRIEHNYEVLRVSPTISQVIDRFTNHQVLVDPVTKQPVEEDPNEEITINAKLELEDGVWRVTFLEKLL